MRSEERKLIIEALLMSSAKPLSLEQLQAVFEEENRLSKEQLLALLSSLEEDYRDRSIELKHVASGFCFQTKEKYSDWVAQMQMEKPPRYSRALLETLAIIAYRQPVTRADIEDIRGVSVNTTLLKTLIEREWIKMAGYRDVPGKPALYVTTKQFLDYFNLAHLNQLPLVDLQPVKEENVHE